MPIFPPPPGAILSSWCIVATTPVADKNVWSVQRYFIAEKLKSVFTLVIEYSGELGLTRVFVEYIYCWIPGNHRLVHWQEGWCLPKKRKELIRHVKQNQKTQNFFQLYHERAETTITIATRINSSFILTPLGHCHPQWVLVSFLYPPCYHCTNSSKAKNYLFGKVLKTLSFQDEVS